MIPRPSLSSLQQPATRPCLRLPPPCLTRHQVSGHPRWMFRSMTLHVLPLPPPPPRGHRLNSLSQEGPDKTSHTDQDSRPPPEAYVQASFLLRAVSDARAFANPCRVSKALHLSPLGKYVLERETCALGNGCALIVVIWEHNIPKVPKLGQAILTLGKWVIT